MEFGWCEEANAEVSPLRFGREDGGFEGESSGSVPSGQ